MRFDKFTQKAQSSLLDAQNLAEGFGHGSVEPGHLLAALLHQEGGVVPAIVAKIGVDPAILDQAVQRAIAAMPRLLATFHGCLLPPPGAPNASRNRSSGG